MKPLIEDTTLQEVRERPMPTGPGVGHSLLLAGAFLGSLMELFAFVPPLVSPVLDLLALGFLGTTATWGLIRLVRRLFR